MPIHYCWDVLDTRPRVSGFLIFVLNLRLDMLLCYVNQLSCSEDIDYEPFTDCMMPCAGRQESFIKNACHFLILFTGHIISGIKNTCESHLLVQNKDFY